MWNFGKHGWTIIIYQAIWFFFMTGMTVDGLNVIVPQLAAYRGWDSDTLLSLSTPASIIALFLVMAFGGLQKKFGLKRMMTITMYAAGIVTILYGFSVNIVMYAVMLVLMVTLINAFAMVLGLSITTNWFPTKKGIVMGVTTVGMNLASALISQVLNLLAGWTDIRWAIAIIGIVILIVGVLTQIFVKVTPEEKGCYPDNDPIMGAKLKKVAEEKGSESTATYGQVLKDPKLWVLSIAYGFFGLATLGVMSQLSSFLQDVKGYELQTSLNIITIAAVIGMVGSVIWGVIDQKIGTKRTSVIFGIWYGIGIALLLVNNMPCFIIGIIMLGAGIGGNGNFPPSMAALIYGRKEFPMYYSVMLTILGCVRSLSFVILAVLHSVTSGYTVPYIVFAILAVLGGVMVAFVKVKPVVDAPNEEEIEQMQAAE